MDPISSPSPCGRNIAKGISESGGNSFTARVGATFAVTAHYLDKFVSCPRKIDPAYRLRNPEGEFSGEACQSDFAAHRLNYADSVDSGSTGIELETYHESPHATDQIGTVQSKGIPSFPSGKRSPRGDRSDFPCSLGIERSSQ